jgi:hypothetical protein
MAGKTRACIDVEFIIRSVLFMHRGTTIDADTAQMITEHLSDSLAAPAHIEDLQKFIAEQKGD